MSASITSFTDHQKNKGHGNSVKPSNGKFTSGPSKDHHTGDEIDSWRNQPPHHQQLYSPSMGAGNDPYAPAYYGAFQYSAPSFAVDGHGPWSTNGAENGFVGGYSHAQQHDSGPPSGHYNNIDNGIFGGGNSAGGYTNFGGQPGFSYGYPGPGNNGDYNTWGPRRGYDDYYNDDRGKMMDGMGALSINERKHSLKDSKDLGFKKSTSWASIASQPAKPTSLLKKKSNMGGIPQPIMLGAWEKNGALPKAPIAAPVQAPHPPAWERMDKVVPKSSPPPPLPMNPINIMARPSVNMDPNHGPPSRGFNQPSHGNQQNYNQSQSSQSQPPQPSSQPQQLQSKPYQNSSTNNVKASPPAPVEKPATSQSEPHYPDEAKMKSDYNPADFDLNAEGARFFVIKSYSEDDIHRSIKYEIWCSTEHGNKRLDQAWRDRDGKGPIYLFFSVNSSGHFCGMAQMMSSVDYDASSSIWCQDKWKGQFKVKWIYVKDVPNAQLRHIKLENNENKPVTNSRDTQEVPLEKGKQVLKILHTFHHTTSIFDDFVHYEKRQEEEDQRKTVVTVTKHAVNHPPHHERNGGRGGYHSNDGSNYYNRDREFNAHSRDNPREDREFYGRGGHRDSHGSERGYHNGGRGGMRDSYGTGRDGPNRGLDKMEERGDRVFYRDRGDRYNDNRGGFRGGRGHRN